MILPRHYSGRIIRLAFIRNRHEYEILHTHFLHFCDLRRPHYRIGIVEVRRIRVFVADILICKIDECTCHRQSLGISVSSLCIFLSGFVVFTPVAACQKRKRQGEQHKKFLHIHIIFCKCTFFITNFNPDNRQCT